MWPQPQPLHNCKTGPSRTSLHSGDTMGIGGAARPRKAQSAAQPHQGLPSVSFYFFFLFSYPQDSVHQRPYPAVDLPNSRCNNQGRRKATTSIQVVSITSIKSVFIHHSTAYPWRGTCLIVLPLAYRTICIVLHSWQYFLNKQCIAFLLIIAFLSYTYVHL